MVSEFFAMGGYAVYVWSAFGFTILLMAGLFMTSVLAAKKSAAEFAALRSERRPRRLKQTKPMRPSRVTQAATETTGR